MYRVLKAEFLKTAEKYIDKDSRENGYIYRVTWKELGVARDMDDALRKFPRGRMNGYSHALEPIGTIH